MLLNYVKQDNIEIAQLQIFDYYPEFCGQEDVVVITNQGYKSYYTIIAKNDYLYLANLETKNPIWNHIYENIEGLYEPFMNVGIEFKKEIIKNIFEENKVVENLVESYGLSKVKV